MRERTPRAGRLHAHDLPALRSEVERKQADIAAAPGDHDALRLAAGELQHARRDRVVEQDRVGRLQRADRLQRELFGIAGTDADERDPAAGRRVPEPSLRHQIFGELRLGGIGFGSKGTVGESFPEAPPLGAWREAFQHAAANPAGERGPSRKALRQRRLDAPPDRLGENRCGAVGRDADHDRGAVDDRAELERGESGAIDDVIWNARRPAASAKALASASSRAAQTDTAAPSRHAGDQGPPPQRCFRPERLQRKATAYPQKPRQRRP